MHSYTFYRFLPAFVIFASQLTHDTITPRGIKIEIEFSLKYNGILRNLNSNAKQIRLLKRALDNRFELIKIDNPKGRLAY